MRDSASRESPPPLNPATVLNAIHWLLRPLLVPITTPQLAGGVTSPAESRSTSARSESPISIVQGVLSGHVDVLVQLARFIDVDFAFVGWFRLRVSVHVGTSSTAPRAQLVARYRRGTGRAHTADNDGPSRGPNEYVSRWIAAPMASAEVLNEALLFRVALEEVALPADSAARWVQLPSVPPIVVRVVCEGVEDPEAASAVFELRRRCQSADFMPIGDGRGVADLDDDTLAASIAPSEAIPKRTISQARHRITARRPSHVFVQCVLQDKHDGLSALELCVHTSGVGYHIRHSTASLSLSRQSSAEEAPSPLALTGNGSVVLSRQQSPLTPHSSAYARARIAGAPQGGFEVDGPGSLEMRTSLENAPGERSTTARAPVAGAKVLPPAPALWEGAASLELALDRAPQLHGALLAPLRACAHDLRESVRTINPEAPHLELSALVAAAASSIGSPPPPPRIGALSPPPPSSPPKGDRVRDRARDLPWTERLPIPPSSRRVVPGAAPEYPPGGSRVVIESGLVEANLYENRLRELWAAGADASSAWAVIVVAMCSVPICTLAEWFAKGQHRIDMAHTGRHLLSRRFMFEHRDAPMLTPPPLEPQALAVALEGFPDDEPLSPGAIAGVLGKKRPERWQAVAPPVLDEAQPTLVEDAYEPRPHGGDESHTTQPERRPEQLRLAADLLRERHEQLLGTALTHEQLHREGGAAPAASQPPPRATRGTNIDPDNDRSTSTLAGAVAGAITGAATAADTVELPTPFYGSSSWKGMELAASVAEAAKLKRVPSSTEASSAAPSQAPQRRPSARPRRRKCNNLIVLIHGYAGSAFDMRLLCSYLQLQLPRVAFLISQANSKGTNTPIETFAERLAMEVDDFISSAREKLELQHISFIAFSIGGCVLSAALNLPHMRKYLPFLHTLCAISCPLLGLLVPSDSYMVASGLWFMANVAGDVTLKEISMVDGQASGNHALLRLNAKGRFPRFKHVLLIGSTQDLFVPLYSSHMQPPGHLPESDPRRQAIARMAENALSSLSGASLRRIAVTFHQQTGVDAIGRAVHVMFLENVPFLRLLSLRYAHFFQADEEEVSVNL